MARPKKGAQRVQCDYVFPEGSRQRVQPGPGRDRAGRCTAMIYPCKTGRCKDHAMVGRGQERPQLILERSTTIWGPRGRDG